MRARVIPLRPQGDETMTCPNSDTLTLFASLGGELEGAEELLAPWHPESLAKHIEDCAACKSTVEDWRSSVAQWKSVDLIDKELFENGYFDKLQEEIETKLWSDTKEITRSEVISLAERRRPRDLSGLPLSAAYAAAALLLLGLGLTLFGGSPPSEESLAILAGNSSDSTELQAGPDANSAEAQGRALGRSLLAALALDDSEGEIANGSVWGVNTLLGGAEDDLEYLYNSGHGSLLDDLSDDEADALIQQL